MRATPGNFRPPHLDPVTEDDLRHFIVEITRRHERATEAMVDRLEEKRMAFVEMRGEIADQRKQIRADTQAVLSVLDRTN
ncbi:MAG TPA: hypothetical protein VFT14_06905 [Solirubrobacterales bacterium]|nr:hypothetical protein [Solirubrobacterales bacterium]